MKIIDSVIEMIFPSSCAICGNDASKEYLYALCDDCGRMYEAEKQSACRSCRRSAFSCKCAPSVALDGDNITYIHLIPYFSALSKKLMAALKHRNVASVRRFLASELEDRLKKEIGFEKFDITFVPRSVEGVKKYGFDQANGLAMLISKDLGARYLKLCRHKRGTAEQKRLGFDERVSNSEMSYEIIGGAALKSDTLVIVDDIVTTGSTMYQMCRAAKNIGAKRIIVLTCAKTQGRYEKEIYAMC